MAARKRQHHLGAYTAGGGGSGSRRPLPLSSGHRRVHMAKPMEQAPRQSSQPDPQQRSAPVPAGGPGFQASMGSQAATQHPPGHGTASQQSFTHTASQPGLASTQAAINAVPAAPPSATAPPRQFVPDASAACVPPMYPLATAPAPSVMPNPVPEGVNLQRLGAEELRRLVGTLHGRMNTLSEENTQALSRASALEAQIAADQERVFDVESQICTIEAECKHASAAEIQALSKQLSFKDQELQEADRQRQRLEQELRVEKERARLQEESVSQLRGQQGEAAALAADEAAGVAEQRSRDAARRATFLRKVKNWRQDGARAVAKVLATEGLPCVEQLLHLHGSSWPPRSQDGSSDQEPVPSSEGRSLPGAPTGFAGSSLHRSQKKRKSPSTASGAVQAEPCPPAEHDSEGFPGLHALPRQLLEAHARVSSDLNVEALVELLTVLVRYCECFFLLTPSIREALWSLLYLVLNNSRKMHLELLFPGTRLSEFEGLNPGELDAQTTAADSVEVLEDVWNSMVSGANELTEALTSESPSSKSPSPLPGMAESAEGQGDGRDRQLASRLVWSIVRCLASTQSSLVEAAHALQLVILLADECSEDDLLVFQPLFVTCKDPTSNQPVLARDGKPGVLSGWLRTSGSTPTARSVHVEGLVVQAMASLFRSRSLFQVAATRQGAGVDPALQHEPPRLFAALCSCIGILPFTLDRDAAFSSLDDSKDVVAWFALCKEELVLCRSLVALLGFVLARHGETAQTLLLAHLRGGESADTLAERTHVIPRLAILLHDTARALEETIDPLLEADIDVRMSHHHSYLQGGQGFSPDEGESEATAGLAQEPERAVLRVSGIIDGKNQVLAHRLSPHHLELAMLREAFVALAREVVQLIHELAIVVEGAGYGLKLSVILSSAGFIHQLGAAIRRLHFYARTKEPALSSVLDFFGWLRDECEDPAFNHTRPRESPAMVEDAARG
mmetsp:Transcript_22554/g.65565  ORF Transcript_22554/g.65565 Transcript_22554/m.65565 type:complete len:963 (-) Transcript_22554:13-2901(-)